MKKEIVDFIIENYGIVTRNKIAQLMNITDSQVKYVARKYNLNSDINVPRNKVNDSAFSIKTPSACYWAGFIAADGNISKDNRYLSICLGRKDLEHLLKLREFIKSESKVYLAKNTGNTQFNANSPKIVKDLKNKFGIGPLKSLTLEPPTGLSYEESLAFIIGYIDGDGSIGINTSKTKHKTYSTLRLRMLGTPKFLSWIAYMLEASSTPKQHCKSKIHVISISEGHGSLSLLKKFIVQNKLPVLDRKWNKVITTTV